jgi:hypothetical protein
MQDGFSYCHLNPIFWEQLLYLPARQYGHKASPTHRGVENEKSNKNALFWAVKSVFHCLSCLKPLVTALVTTDTSVENEVTQFVCFLFFCFLFMWFYRGLEKQLIWLQNVWARKSKISYSMILFTAQNNKTWATRTPQQHKTTTKNFDL